MSKKFSKIGISLLIFLLFFLVISCNLPNNRKQIIISEWIDGDTFQFYESNNNAFDVARLSNVDTPELFHENKTANLSGRYLQYKFALKAHDYSDFFYKKNNIYAIKSFQRDTYNRLIVDLFYDNSFASKELIKHGLAIPSYWWIDSLFYNVSELWKEMETAMENKRGFWEIILKDDFDQINLSVNEKNELALYNLKNRTLMQRFFKNWESIRKYYPLDILNKFLL